MQANKKKIVDDLGVHYRDLRYLEPLVPTPYPAAIFIRDKALVVNLESLRMLVTKDKVTSFSVLYPLILSGPEVHVLTCAAKTAATCC
jgi:hypothetical protein